MSGDSNCMIEYWSGSTGDYKFPSVVQFKYKTDTDLYEFAKVRLEIHHAGYSCIYCILLGPFLYVRIKQFHARCHLHLMANSLS